MLTKFSTQPENTPSLPHSWTKNWWHLRWAEGIWMQHWRCQSWKLGDVLLVWSSTSIHMLKSSGYVHHLVVSSPGYLWITKGKMVTFQWGVLVGTTVIKGLRWTSSVMTQLDITCLSRRCPESTLLLWHPFPQMPNFNLVISKLQANPDWGTLYKTIWPMLFKNIKAVKDKTGEDEMPWVSLNQNPINI